MSLEVKKPKMKDEVPQYLIDMLVAYAVDNIMNQHELSGLYGDLLDDRHPEVYDNYGRSYAKGQKIKEKGKEIYNILITSIRQSNGKLTISKIKKEEI